MNFELLVRERLRGDWAIQNATAAGHMQGVEDRRRVRAGEWQRMNSEFGSSRPVWESKWAEQSSGLPQSEKIARVIPADPWGLEIEVRDKPEERLAVDVFMLGFAGALAWQGLWPAWIVFGLWAGEMVRRARQR